MYLTGRCRCLWHVVRSGRAVRFDQPPHAVQVLRRVDADGVRGGFHGRDAKAVLERAQLLEAFGTFERRRREGGQSSAGTPAGRRTGRGAATTPAAAVRRARTERRAREVQRVAFAIDRRPSRRSGCRGRPGRRCARRSVPSGRRPIQQQLRPRRRSPPARSRLVALDVDDDLGVESGGDFGEPIGAGRVIAARHHGDAAEAVHRRRRSARSSVATTTASTKRAWSARAVDVLDHRRPSISASGLPGSRVD